MRKVLIAVVGALLLTGVAFAQDEDTVDIAPDGDTWIGLSTGYPIGLTAHYGLGNGLGEGIDLRFNGQFYSGSLGGLSSLGFNIGADALFTIPVDAEDITVYAGAGPKLGFEIAGGALTGGNVGGFSLSAQALAGVEYLVDPQIGIFIEPRVGFNYVTGVPGLSVVFAPNLTFGANYHF